MKTIAPGKERILSVARELMILKGYSRTSIDEICTKAKVQKGTFFYHFKNKNALGIALVEYHLKMGADMMAGAAFLKEQNPLKKLMLYVDFIIDNIDDPDSQGCLLGVFSSEVADKQKEIQAACAIGFESWANQLESLIDVAKKSLNNNAQINSRELANLFLVIFEGAVILARGTGKVGHIRTNLNYYKKYLNNILT